MKKILAGLAALTLAACGGNNAVSDAATGAKMKIAESGDGSAVLPSRRYHQ